MGSSRLLTVQLPKTTVPHFLAISSANTELNLETCGLLLGKKLTPSSSGGYSASIPLHLKFSVAPDGSPSTPRYVVETLLIPKQRSTSDTCTIHEEESVLQFAADRGQLTLGWIHTHPSQSLFMSSVDLHTHANLQRILPESFAVVCAPKSNPNFGIFRLTDPPGVHTVLNCRETPAFHLHPDMPIYTVATRKGHVRIREAALEILDLR
ncbi:hypothetical protein B0H19DRAFT_968213 [Mycena capillaripes]|nr:hypothetical protein B0H19DRAFT_968213 [Mycena capillaripes]